MTNWPNKCDLVVSRATSKATHWPLILIYCANELVGSVMFGLSTFFMLPKITFSVARFCSYELASKCVTLTWHWLSNHEIGMTRTCRFSTQT